MKSPVGVPATGCHSNIYQQLAFHFGQILLLKWTILVGERFVYKIQCIYASYHHKRWRRSSVRCSISEIYLRRKRKRRTVRFHETVQTHRQHGGSIVFTRSVVAAPSRSKFAYGFLNLTRPHLVANGRRRARRQLSSKTNALSLRAAVRVKYVKCTRFKTKNLFSTDFPARYWDVGTKAKQRKWTTRRSFEKIIWFYVLSQIRKLRVYSIVCKFQSLQLYYLKLEMYFQRSFTNLSIHSLFQMGFGFCFVQTEISNGMILGSIFCLEDFDPPSRPLTRSRFYS